MRSFGQSPQDDRHILSMLAKVFSAILKAIQAQLVEVEVSANKGLRSFTIVGLADTAIKEAKERVCSAIKNSGLKAPHQETRKVVVNLAPADLKKEGSYFDLAIALGYLLASGQIQFIAQNKLILGELALNGDLKPIRGALSFALLAKEMGFAEIILPKANAREACLVNLSAKNNLKISGAANLKEAILYLENKKDIPQETALWEDFIKTSPDNVIDLSWIKGQRQAKRCLEMAVAGGHNLLFEGPPGTGKTLLAKAALSIMPSLSPEEMVELTQIYSANGLLNNGSLNISRPFRAPRPSASEPAIIGGGSPARAGEITLAHRGVLFLDEFPEFHRDVLESLRQPLEQGEITVQRSKQSFTLPARFFLIAAANPCPCGFHNDPEKECKCAPSQLAAYQRKMSGPLMDRIDLFCWIAALKYDELSRETEELESPAMKARVERAREIQKQRFAKDNILTNSEMTLPLIKKHCLLDSPSRDILKLWVDTGKLSGRGFHRVLKTARTLADLEEQENITADHINEVLNYRRKSDN